MTQQKKKKAPLSAKMKLFCKEYMIDLNATQAAVRAGYSPKSAREIGNENLKKPAVMEYLKKMMDKRATKLEITAERVLQEYARIGFSQITDFVHVQTVGEEQKVVVKDTKDLSLEQIAALASIEQGEFGIKVKLHEKIRALDAMSKHLGVFREELKITNDISVTIVDDIKEDEE
ncbi:MAG: terminase small subunit [Aerococcus urinaeequi]